MKRTDGFALIAVLWLLVSLSAIGLEVGLRFRAQHLTVINTVESAKALAAAEGGLQYIHARLTESLREAQRFRQSGGDPLDRWAGLDSLLRDTLVLGDVRVDLALQDPGSMLHLNGATEEELRRLFRALRIDFGHADRLAQTVMDWKDEDDLRRGRGAEREDYFKAGLTTEPGNRPFRHPAELQDVLGMTISQYNRIRPFVTVYGSGRININAAAREVLLTLPGVNDETANVIIKRRLAGRPIRSVDDLLLLLSEGARNMLAAHQAAFLNRAIFSTRELVVTSKASPTGSPVQSQVIGHFALAGDEAMLVGLERSR